MENSIFEELYEEDYKRVDLEQNKVSKMYKPKDNEKTGNFYMDDDNNFYPSGNILDEDNKEYYEQFFDFDIEELSNMSKEDIEIEPAKITNGSIEKGRIKLKEKEEVIEETQTEKIVEEPTQNNEELENSKKEMLEKTDAIKEKTEERIEQPRNDETIEQDNFTKTNNNIEIEEPEILEEEVQDKTIENIEIKNDISFDYYEKTEIENIQKELLKNITELKYSFMEHQNKIKQKKEKIYEIFKTMPPLDPKWAKTNQEYNKENYRLNGINNIINSDNFKTLLDIENTINNISIEHNKETKKYHITSKINPYELAQRTSKILSAIANDVNKQDLGSEEFVNSITNKIQQINNNMKKLYSKFGYTDLYFEIKNSYDKINYLKNQINHWKELEKIQGKSYEREINEALYEIEVTKNTIKSKINNLPEEEKNKITNIDDVKNIIKEIENNKEPIGKEKPKEQEYTVEEPEQEYNDREELINAIKGIVSTIDLNAKAEEINQKLALIEKHLIELNKIDQLAFEDKYNNAKTDEEKQQLITERENQVESYRDLLKHENKEIEDLLSERFNPLIDKFKSEIINKTKDNPEIPKEDPTKETEEPQQEIPKKGRLKVIATKALKWMKEHKLAIVAIGLAITTALFVIPTTHMMINSALWSVGTKLGWNASTLGKLHSINLGLSKSVASGAYAFEEISGAYTLGGAVGAQALYGAGAANLVAAITGLVGLGTVGTFGASIINKIKNRNKKKEEPQQEIPTEKPIEEEVEVIEETKDKEKEKEVENEKSTPLTKEQIAEMIKSEIEKAVAQKNEEISKLTVENQNLREQIEMLKQQGLSTEELEEEQVRSL